MTIQNLQELNDELQALANIKNQTPVEEFDGLSPTDMVRLLYKPIDDKDSIVRLNTNIQNEQLSSAKFVHDILKYLTLIKEQQPLQLTKQGYLPPALCHTLAELKMLEHDNWWYEDKKQKVVKEVNFYYIGLLNMLPLQFGLVRKRNNSLTLTKIGESFLLGKPLIELYNYLLVYYVKKFNWGYSDLYPDAPLIQQGILFMIHIIQKYGNEFRNKSFYFEKFQQAFPSVLRDFEESNGYSTPEERFGNCIHARVFERFLKRFGLIETEPTADKAWVTNLKKQPLIDDLFIWNDVHWFD